MKGVVSDQIVFIRKDGAGIKVCMVVFRHLDGKEYRYIPSRYDIRATSVFELYLKRWAIETFFAWIKRYLNDVVSEEQWSSYGALMDTT